MNAHVSEQPALPFNRHMFRWAREFRELTIEDAAHRVGVRPEVVTAWENGNAIPTVRQARILSDLYQRSFLEFFRDEPPPVSEPRLVPDFRLHRGTAPPHETRDLKDLQAWAEEMRLNALDLYDILGEAVPVVPDALRANLEEVPAAAAARARGALSFPIEEQAGLKRTDRDALPKLFRHKVENAAILVLKTGGLKDFGARGLCIAVEPLPVIVFGAEAPSAQMFTLAHELAHVCLAESAISGPPADARRPSREARVERWCNQFAAAFLVPEDALA
jgi:transcriptional regulator with XRE-family HTH domain